MFCSGPRVGVRVSWRWLRGEGFELIEVLEVRLKVVMSEFARRKRLALPQRRIGSEESGGWKSIFSPHFNLTHQLASTSRNCNQERHLPLSVETRLHS